MPLSRSALALPLALAACGSDAPEATASPKAVAQPVQGYEACREQAAGEPSALIACADRAIARAGSTVDSPEAVLAFREALQELGDVAAGQDGQGAQVAFANKAVTAARQRAALLAGKPGETARAAPPTIPQAWARSRDLSCREHPVPRCAARYDALLALLQDAPRKDPEVTASSQQAGLPLPTCAQLHAEGKVGSALADAFYARYPKPLAGEDSVETVALNTAGLDNVVRYLACVAGATDYDPVVADNGLALFASHRHGAAALRNLKALGDSNDPSAEAARRFLAQIREYLAGPAG